MRNKDAR